MGHGDGMQASTQGLMLNHAPNISIRPKSPHRVRDGLTSRADLVPHPNTGQGISGDVQGALGQGAD
eukprot:219004-Alexandrium_andersonii.AAC.1